MIEFVIQVLHGLTLGSLFALVAVGYTMVYGIIKLINFAHGEFYMAGGFVGLLSLGYLSQNLLAQAPGGIKLLFGLTAAALCVALLAVATEWLAYRPIRNSGRIAALLTAVGISLLLQNSSIAIFGNRQTAFPQTVSDEKYPRFAVDLDSLNAGDDAPWRIAYRQPLANAAGEILRNTKGQPLGYMNIHLVEAGATIAAEKLEQAKKHNPDALYAYPAITLSLKQLIVFGFLGLTSLGLYWLVQRSRLGRAMRAVSVDMQAAALMGISPDKIIMLTFLVGGSLAGMDGVLAGGMFIGSVDPMMGFMLGLKAFIAAVVGGIGSIPGAMVGGLILGLTEMLAQHYADSVLFDGASAYRDAIAFLLLIGVLLIKPTGLFGRFEGEKV